MKTIEKERVKTRSSKETKIFLIDFFLNFIKPSAYIDNVSEIDVNALKNQGIKTIICDLDNTLVPHFNKFPQKFAFNFVEKVKKEGLDFIIVSNNTSKRVSFFADKLGVKNYIAGAKKPFTFIIKKKLLELDIKPHEVIFIGDMIIMDMFAANLLKSDSILVKPLIDADKSWTKIMHFLEKWVFKKLDKKNLLVSNIKVRKELYKDLYEEL